MEDADFSDEFCRFLQRAIPAVDAAELLLLLADRPEAWWQPMDAVAALSRSGLTQPEAARYLDVFAGAGVIERAEDGRVRYRAATEEDARHVRTLAQAYEERPVTLIRMIYALRDSKISTFADAFRLRKK
jgi:hypothetical protein